MQLVENNSTTPLLNLPNSLKFQTNSNKMIDGKKGKSHKFAQIFSNKIALTKKTIVGNSVFISKKKFSQTEFIKGLKKDYKKIREAIKELLFYLGRLDLSFGEVKILINYY